MVAYSFQKRFVGLIEAGLEPGPWCPGMKRHTLRLPRGGRSRHARPGERVQLYTGQRTRHCRKVGEAHVVAVRPVRLIVLARRMFLVAREGWQRCDDWQSRAEKIAPAARFLLETAPDVMHPDMDAFARTNGFADAADMRAFFDPPADGGTLDLTIIVWAPLRGPGGHLAG